MIEKNKKTDSPDFPLKPYPATTDYITDRTRNDSKSPKR